MTKVSASQHRTVSPLELDLAQLPLLVNCRLRRSSKRRCKKRGKSLAATIAAAQIETVYLPELNMSLLLTLFKCRKFTKYGLDDT